MIKANLGLANKGIGRIPEHSADAHIRTRGTVNTVSPPSRCPQSGVRMRLPFCILKVLGDVLDDGELYFVEAAQTLDAARARVQSLAEARPGEYVIYDEATGERVLITAASPASAGACPLQMDMVAGQCNNLTLLLQALASPVSCS
jgi:hypothetical protein